jgi:Ser/Thr protein kinase RdoA (MazF antagonist)
VTEPAEALLAICRRLLDTDAHPVAVHQGHNGTVVLRAATATGEVIVKLHRGLDRHRQEVHAYQHWTPALRGRTPRLLASTEDPPAIVITALPGRTLAEADLPPQREVEAHRQAGELLRRLHAAVPSRTEPDMTAWLAERGEYWLALGREIIPARRQAEIRAHLTALSDLGPIPAVPCHLDYTPRNLLVGQSDQVGVIDFEHARYDLAARDLVRLATRTWPTRRDLEHAFLDGYGPLDALDHQIIEHCSYLDALTSGVRAAGQQPSPVRHASVSVVDCAGSD